MIDFLSNAVLRIAFTISAPGLDYGKMTFFKFARKCQSSVTGKHPTARFDTWKEKRLLLIIPAYEKARMIRNSFANHPGF